MTVNAHFDGKAIIPDEPLDLPPNQALIVQIESVGSRDLADRHDHYLYGSPTSDGQR